MLHVLTSMTNMYCKDSNINFTYPARHVRGTRSREWYHRYPCIPQGNHRGYQMPVAVVVPLASLESAAVVGPCPLALAQISAGLGPNF